MRALVIAHNTFREATRDRILAGVFAAGLVLIALTQIADPLTLGEGRRLTVDLGLSGIGLLGTLIVLLVGTSLVAKEVERRTIYNLLSRPLARPEYLIGKWAGLTAALWIVAAGLGLALWAVLAVRGAGAAGPAVMQSLYFTALELAVITAIAVLFSALSTPVLSALYTLGLALAGHWSDDLRAFASKFPEGLRPLLETFANLIPNLPLFNTRTLAAHGEFAGATHVAFATGYAIAVVACVLALAAAAFETRDFK